jgi:hypothetical protein
MVPMRHPDAVARLMRPRSTWRDGSERGSRDHDALGFEDAAHLLASAPPVAYAAFQLRHSDERPDLELLQHLLAIAKRELRPGLKVTPETLVIMAVAEERCAESQRTAKHRYTFAGVSRGFWEWNCERPYARVSAAIDQLCGDCWRAILARSEEVT